MSQRYKNADKRRDTIGILALIDKTETGDFQGFFILTGIDRMDGIFYKTQG